MALIEQSWAALARDGWIGEGDFACLCYVITGRTCGCSHISLSTKTAKLKCRMSFQAFFAITFANTLLVRASLYSQIQLL